MLDKRDEEYEEKPNPRFADEPGNSRNRNHLGHDLNNDQDDRSNVFDDDEEEEEE